MSMSKKKCCVPGCLESDSHPPLHSFPNPAKDIQRFNQWVFAIGGDIIGLQNDDIYKHRSVCHLHFEEKFWCRYNRLSNIAVPTLNLPGPTSVPKFTNQERKPLRQTENFSISKPSTSGFLDFPVSSTPAVNTRELKNDRADKENTEPISTYQERKTSSLAEMPGSSSGISLPLAPAPYSTEVQNDATEKEKEPISTYQERKTSSQAEMPGSSSGISVPLAPAPYSTEVQNDATEKEKGPVSKQNTVFKRTKKYAKVTLAEQKLYEKLVRARIKLSKCRNKMKKQSASLKAAKRLISNPVLMSTMEKLPKTAKVLTMMQFREVKKKTKGRRFSLQEKILALSIFKQAPKGYKFLRKILILPAPQTLAKLISRADLKPGINKIVICVTWGQNEILFPEGVILNSERSDGF